MENTAQKAEDNSIEIGNNVSQYLSFMLAGEEYGVDILSVQEIKGWDTLTPMPNTPEYILGIINLRGTIVPIMDLRKRFELGEAEFGPTTVVIVVKIDIEGQQRTMGMVVDAVSEVYNVTNAEMNPPPDFGCVVDMDFVKGLASIEQKMIIMLDVALIIKTEIVDKIGNRLESVPVEG